MWAEPLRTLLVNVGRGSVRLSAVMSEATVPAKRTIVFSHATGFCKEVFLPVFRELRSLGLRDADLVALDLRTHGDSGVVNASVLTPEGPRAYTFFKGTHSHLLPESGQGLVGAGQRCRRLCGASQAPASQPRILRRWPLVRRRHHVRHSHKRRCAEGSLTAARGRAG